MATKLDPKAPKDKAPKAKKVKDPSKPGRVAQVKQSYTMTKKSDPRIGLILLGTFLLAGLAGFALMLAVFGSLWFPILIGVLVGLFAVLVVFGRRAATAAYKQIEGRPGAAAAALQQLRRGWKTDPAVAVSKQQDIVTRVVGRPGIVLIGEGNPTRLKGLLASERRRHERVAREVPIHEMVVGNAPGQVPLPKLTKTVQKLGKEVKPAQLTDVLARIKAIDAHRAAVPMPKGPVPTSMKGMRSNMRGR